MHGSSVEKVVIRSIYGQFPVYLGPFIHGGVPEVAKRSALDLSDVLVTRSGGGENSWRAGLGGRDDGMQISGRSKSGTVKARVRGHASAGNW